MMTCPTNIEELSLRFNSDEFFDFIFFWGHKPKTRGMVDHHCLSQWFAASFEISGITYPTAEHFMMAEKARLFGDTATLKEILMAKDPQAVKILGRKITGFVDSIWKQHRFDIVIKGNIAKFSQNPSLNNYLRLTERKILVEASPYDSIWGIGVSEHEDAAHNPNLWQGLNLLGFAIMVTRSRLFNIQTS